MPLSLTASGPRPVPARRARADRHAWRPRLTAAAGAATALVAVLACASFAALATLADPVTVVDLAADAPLRVAGGLAGLALALLATNLWLLGRAERVALQRLADALAQRTAGGPATPLPEQGPAAVAHLARTINAGERRHAEHVAEHLDMLAAFAHDLRAPLTRLGLRCERVQDDALRAAMARDLAELASLVDGSLACARTLRGADTPLRRVDADGLLQCLVGDYQDAGRDVRLEGAVGQPVLTCPRALRRVLVNLIENALRYGGDARLCVRREARRLVLAIVDDGPGIAPAELEAVFAPWYRATGSARHGEGSGLGLAIARRLAQAMRGELQLENRRGGGLEARLTLPLAGA